MGPRPTLCFGLHYTLKSNAAQLGTAKHLDSASASPRHCHPVASVLLLWETLRFSMNDAPRRSLLCGLNTLIHRIPSKNSSDLVTIAQL
jgi:hypothetical protein